MAKDGEITTKIAKNAKVRTGQPQITQTTRSVAPTPTEGSLRTTTDGRRFRSAVRLWSFGISSLNGHWGLGFGHSLPTGHWSLETRAQARGLSTDSVDYADSRSPSANLQSGI